MKIRELLEYDAMRSKYVGFVDLGEEFSADSDTMASEALVFMVGSVIGSWKQPVAYFLIKGTNSSIFSFCMRQLSLTYFISLKVFQPRFRRSSWCTLFNSYMTLISMSYR